MVTMLEVSCLGVVAPTCHNLLSFLVSGSSYIVQLGGFYVVHADVTVEFHPFSPGYWHGV